MISDLEQHRVDPSLGVYYIPDFVTAEEEVYLLRKIAETPQPKWKSLSNRRLQVWGGEITRSNSLIPSALPSFLTTFPDIIPRLRSTGLFTSSKHGEPNHVIINEYLPGQGIMPHEDGPAYHPVVATISLGSHTVFNYYRYDIGDSAVDSSKVTTQNDPSSLMAAGNKGRAIDPKPVLSLLLEPRSLVITTASLYSECLHGIDETSIDSFVPTSSNGQKVANANMIKDSMLKQIVTEGGELERGTRISLTCRDVEKVNKAFEKR